jgi:hypothetical protein
VANSQPSARPPTILKWEDHVWNGRITRVTSMDGRKWSISLFEGIGYSLSVGGTSILVDAVASLGAAKELAQHLQNVLDGWVSAPPELLSPDLPATAGRLGDT